jgi:hypothetical protein
METRLARALLSGEMLEGGRIRVDVRDGALTVTHDAPVGSAA